MKKLLLLALCTLAACTPALDEGYRPPENASVTMAWKTAPSDDEGEVRLHLILSGGVEQDVDVGTFSGELLTSFDGSPDPLLHREWWAGSDDVVSVSRKDDTHLSIERISMDDTSDREEIMTVEIPANLYVTCVDDEGGCG